MKTKLLLVFMLTLNCVNNYAQTNLLWKKHFNGLSSGLDMAVDMKIDYDGNIVVTGITGSMDTSAIIFDIVTIKYTPAGDTVWTKIYGASGNVSCEVIGLNIDASNNIYLTGFKEEDYVKTMLTIKYNTNGNLVWVREYGVSNADLYGVSILINGNQDLFVVGNGGIVNGENIYLIKYLSNGEFAWVKTLSYSIDGSTFAECAIIDASDNVFITGRYSETAFGYTNILTAKYYPTGDTAWVRTYDGPSNAYDFANAITTDFLGNIYVTGLSEADHGGGPEGDYVTIKYSNNGNEIWVARYDGGAGGDWPTDILVDNSGSVYVTGWSISEIDTKFAATIKYNPAGQQLWEYRYKGDGYYFNEPHSLGITMSGILLVAGTVSDTDFTQDWVLLAINCNAGDTLWTVRYDGSATDSGIDIDTPKKLLVDNQDNIYICGFSDETNSDWDITTLKYSSPTLSINPIGNTSSVSVYPNPASGILNIYSSENILKIDIYNILGENVYSTTNIHHPNYSLIDLSSFLKGVYFIRLYCGNKHFTEKVIVR